MYVFGNDTGFQNLKAFPPTRCHSKCSSALSAGAGTPPFASDAKTEARGCVGRAAGSGKRPSQKQKRRPLRPHLNNWSLSNRTTTSTRSRKYCFGNKAKAAFHPRQSSEQLPPPRGMQLSERLHAFPITTCRGCTVWTLRSGSSSKVVEKSEVMDHTYLHEAVV